MRSRKTGPRSSRSWSPYLDNPRKFQNVSRDGSRITTWSASARVFSLLWDGWTWFARLHWDFLASQHSIDNRLHRRRSDNGRSAAARALAPLKPHGIVWQITLSRGIAAGSSHGIVRESDPVTAAQLPTTRRCSTGTPRSDAGDTGQNVSRAGSRIRHLVRALRHRRLLE